MGGVYAAKRMDEEVANQPKRQLAEGDRLVRTQKVGRPKRCSSKGLKGGMGRDRGASSKTREGDLVRHFSLVEFVVRGGGNIDTTISSWIEGGTDGMPPL